jgi:hypothetical protein
MHKTNLKQGGQKMASVLCTGADPLLVETRARILEQAGDSVAIALSEKELLSACEKTRFDVAVIGQTTSPREKQRILQLVRLCCPTARVLELFAPTTGRELTDADDWLEVPGHIPTDLVEKVSILANNRLRWPS